MLGYLDESMINPLDPISSLNNPFFIFFLLCPLDWLATLRFVLVPPPPTFIASPG